jgi:Ni/Fe-hydrogenase b-type cytochrome subunit
MDPMFGPTSFVGEQTGFLMGWVRFIHFIAAFGWLVEGLTRIWSAFTSSDRYLRWSSMWPLKNKKDFRNLGHTLLHYTFVKTEAPVYLGHNALQQLAYLAVYALCALQMVIGFALFSLYYPENPFWRFMSTPTHWIGVPAVRLLHVCVMFVLWAFVIIHVYLVFRADSTERHGGLSAMVNGGVWMKRGTQPVDAPLIA